MIPEASSFSCRHLWSSLVLISRFSVVNSVEVKDLPLSAVHRLNFFSDFSFVFFSAHGRFRHKNVSEKPKAEERTSIFYSERNIYVNHGYHFLLESEHGLLTSRIYFQFQHCSMRPPKKKNCIVLSPTAPIQTNKPAIFDQLCQTIEIILQSPDGTGHYRTVWVTV